MDQIEQGRAQKRVMLEAQHYSTVMLVMLVVVLERERKAQWGAESSHPRNLEENEPVYVSDWRPGT